MASGTMAPFTGLTNLQRTINRFFDDVLDPLEGGVMGDTQFAPAFDMEETNDYYLFSIDVPGINKNDIRIEIVNNNLLVSGERKEEHKERGKRGYVERRYGRFQRMFALPTTVNADRIEASCDNGVLRIAVPKAEEARPRQIPISDGKLNVFQKLAQGVKEKIAATTNTQVPSETTKH